MLLFAPKFADPVSDFLGVDLDQTFISNLLKIKFLAAAWPVLYVC